MPNVHQNPYSDTLLEKVKQLNPGRLTQIIGETQYTSNGRIYNDMEALQRLVAEEYAAHKEAYDQYQVGDHVAGGGSWVDPETGRIIEGVNPGVSLDMSAYDLSPQAQADVQGARDTANSIMGRDSNRFAIDPSDLQQVGAYTMDPATADVYTADFENTFDPTRDQLNYANQLNDYAMNIDGTALGNAAELQYLAATGQMPSFADRSLQRDANALFAAQNALASRARGSSGAGLAMMNAQNNSALGYAQLMNAADIARAQEMTDARAALANTGGVIRQGNFQGANQAAQNASQLYAVNNSELGAQQQNAASLNQGSQFNTGVQNTAAEFNVGQQAAAAGANSKMLQDTLEGNRKYGFEAEGRDDQLAQGYVGQLIAAGENDRSAAITGEQNFAQVVGQNADRKANMFTNSATTAAQLAGQREAAQAQQTSGIIGGIGAGIGALASVISDRRAKTLMGPSDVADFTDADDYAYEYNERAGAEAGERHVGPMAQDLPDDVVERGPDGMLRVNLPRLAMRYAPAIGKLQREVDALKGKRS